MIIVKLIDGLGNQLFQYAVGRHLAYINKTELKLDISEFETYKLHAYSLTPFCVNATIATKDEVARFQKYKRKPGRKWFLYNRLVANPNKYVQEKQFHFDPDVLSVKGPAYLDGFWQTEKYFKEIEQVIRKEVALKIPPSPLSAELVGKIKAEKNAVAVHIRRGDYANNPNTLKYHGTCSIEYYMRATKYLADKIGTPHFFIFSDDPTWVKENIKLAFPTTYVDHNKADKNYEDLILMSTCKHNIIANSSFSWWGAWLNTNPDKIVVAPEKWFNSTKAGTQTHDLIPETWTKMS